MTIDTARLEQLTGQFAVDFGAALHAATVVLGDRLGLYRTLAEIGPVDGAGLAAAAGCDPRLVEEWLKAQYVSGYCCGDPETGTFWLDPEQTVLLADDTNPGCLVGAMTIAAALWKDEEEVGRRFRAGGGFGWHEHHHDLFDGTERLFRPGYAADLASVEQARKRAVEAGVADRVRFEVASAGDFPGGPDGRGYDLVCVFDALHDNVNPVGRIFYSASPFICTPAAKSQDGGHALGNQVPDATWRELLTGAGFTRFRRATETPFNRVFEVRP